MTSYKYSITCQDDLLTVDNAQSHVTAFRPISEAARSWSDDNASWLLCCKICLLTYLLNRCAVFVCVGLFDAAACRCTLRQRAHRQTAARLQVSSQPVRPGTSNYFHSLTLCISTPEQGIAPAAARRYVPRRF